MVLFVDSLFQLHLKFTPPKAIIARKDLADILFMFSSLYETYLEILSKIFSFDNLGNFSCLTVFLFFYRLLRNPLCVATLVRFLWTVYYWAIQLNKMLLNRVCYHRIPRMLRTYTTLV